MARTLNKVLLIGHVWRDPIIKYTPSGTAVANCFPAVVEASMDHVPMIIITADRPPELQEIRANQTIDQQYIFGRYPRQA